MAANSRAGRATPGKTGAARKVASPRRQAAAAEPAPEPTPARRGRPTKTVPAAAPKAAAGTRGAARTATAGAAARTAQPRRSRTAAAGSVVVEPSEILDAQDRGSSAADQTQQAPPGVGMRNADGVIDHAEVEWRGRTWLVRLPTIEQMTIYRRLAKRFQALGEDQGKPDAAAVSMEEATTHFDRALKLITSILVTPEDVMWIEDEMLEGRLQLSDASELMRDAIERFGELNPMEETGTRAERRALKTGKARLAD